MQDLCDFLLLLPVFYFMLDWSIGTFKIYYLVAKDGNMILAALADFITVGTIPILQGTWPSNMDMSHA